MNDALDLLRAAVARTSITAVAKRIGYSRPAVSAVLAGTYGAATGRLLARATDILGAVTCPHDAQTRTAQDCRERAARPRPTASPIALRHWRACQTCVHGGKADVEP